MSVLGDHFGVCSMEIGQIIPELRMRKDYYWKNASYGDNGIFYGDFGTARCNR